MPNCRGPARVAVRNIDKVLVSSDKVYNRLTDHLILQHLCHVLAFDCDFFHSVASTKSVASDDSCF